MLSLTDFKDPEKEYQRLYANLNRLYERYNLVCEKNKKLHTENVKLKQQIKDLNSLPKT